MIAGILLSFSTIFLVLKAIWLTDKNKTDILSLYVMLDMNEIRLVFDRSCSYLDGLLIQGGIEKDYLKERGQTWQNR
jgi:hypothetical protein